MKSQINLSRYRRTGDLQKDWNNVRPWPVSWVSEVNGNGEERIEWEIRFSIDECGGFNLEIKNYFRYFFSP